MQWERKFRVLHELNYRVYFRNRSFVCAVSVSSGCSSRSHQFLTRSSSHHLSCHFISRNLTPAFGDKLLYMLQFWNHSVCPIFIWVHFAWIYSFITSNTHLQLSLIFMCAAAFLPYSPLSLNFCVIRDHSFSKRCLLLCTSTWEFK
jgi:hypothetical protein